MKTFHIYRYGSLDAKEHTDFYADGNLGERMRKASEYLDSTRPGNMPPRCGSLYASPTLEACVQWRESLTEYVQKETDCIFRLEVPGNLHVFDAEQYDITIEEGLEHAEKYWQSALTLEQYFRHRETLTSKQQEELDYWHEILLHPADIIGVTTVTLPYPKKTNN